MGLTLTVHSLEYYEDFIFIFFYKFIRNNLTPIIKREKTTPEIKVNISYQNKCFCFLFVIDLTETD